VDGQLFGTKLTLDKVAMNLFNAGYRIEDIFKMVSYNPARALNLLDRGEIDIGKKAHLCVFDEQMKFVKVLK
jgi:N-acetylglucosamine-6-phosphate deacetylase